MKSLVSILLVSILGVSFGLSKSPQELDKTVRKLAPDLVASTVAIMVNGGSGSGVIVTPEGLVITAAHVTGEPGRKLQVLLSDGRELPATSLGVDHDTDGALLQINAPGPFPHQPYIKEKNYDVGDWAIATGHPGGPIVGRPSPVRLGRITEAGTKSGFSDAITTTATVISGDSGGPLFNLDGEVIGINSNISAPWTINKHVPLPSILERWDALMASESFGRSMQFQQQQSEFLFDEPYADLREQFEEAVAEKAESDPEAAELQARPRLLDPHHMQSYLDRWKPDEEAPKAPQYGLKFALDSPTVVEVLPESPAEDSGISVGDFIIKANGFPIGSTIDLALLMKKGEPLTLTNSEERDFVLEPNEVIARRFFPQPVAGMIPMMMTDQGGSPGDPDLPEDEDFQQVLEDLRKQLENSIVTLSNSSGDVVAHATVIHSAGKQLLTKASEIENIADLTARIQDSEYPVEIMGVDKESDLALIRILAPDLEAVSWQPREPEVGQLVLTPTRKSMVAGVISQPARNAPQQGFEINHRPGDPSAYLGISLSPESEGPVVETVEIGSPADKTGFLEGDELLKFEGSKIEDGDSLAKKISEKAPGDKVAFVVKRGTEEVTLEPILDVRPAASAGNFDRSASQRDGQLSSLSSRGGRLSERSDGFGRSLYHDQRINAQLAGSPLVNLDGEVVGINIARAMRHRSLAIPTLEIHSIVTRLRARASRRR